FLINTRGAAPVAAEAGAEVHGLIWEITEAHVHALDGFEGVAKGRYYRDFLKVRSGEGEMLRPLIYIDPITERGVPKEKYEKYMKYMEKVYGAAEAAGFPPAYLDELRAWFPGRE
ncbi:MAG: gamma-glutamylcyclotransferase, partial [bacterium]|nr:gamma-glutamylcyclotransferase [bacterium]